MCLRGTHTGIILYYLFIILSMKKDFCRILTYWISHRGYQRNVFTFSTVKMLKTLS